MYTRFLNGGSFTFTYEDGTTTTETRGSNGLNWYQLYSDSGNPITLKEYSQVLDSGASDDFYAIEINSTAVCVPGANVTKHIHWCDQYRYYNVGTVLTFPSSNGFGCVEPGDVVQDPDVKVISKDEDCQHHHR